MFRISNQRRKMDGVSRQSIVLLVMILLCSACSQKAKHQKPKANKHSTVQNSSSCVDFHEGTFIENTDSVGAVQIVRDSLFQYEFYGNGKKSIWNLQWITDCTYMLTLNKGAEETDSIMQNRIIVVNIIEHTDSSYRYSAEMEGYDGTIENTLLKIKEE